MPIPIPIPIPVRIYIYIYIIRSQDLQNFADWMKEFGSV